MASATLPSTETIYGVETELRRREEFIGEKGPQVKCGNWCCYTAKYDYGKERELIASLAIGHGCDYAPGSGRLVMELVLPARNQGGRMSLQDGTYVARLRPYSLAGPGKWSRVYQFQVELSENHGQNSRPPGTLIKM